MRAYIIRRLLLMIPTLLLVSILVFLLIRFIPGDVIDEMFTTMSYQGGMESRAALERALGLDVPAHVQYARWIGGMVLHGTLGKSLLGSAIRSRSRFSAGCRSPSNLAFWPSPSGS